MQPKIKTPKRHFFLTQKAVLIIVAAVAVCGAVAFAALTLGYKSPAPQKTADKASASTSSRGVNQVDYSPAEKTDNSTNEQIKGNGGTTPKDTGQTSDSPTSQAPFSVTITRAANTQDGNGNRIVTVGSIVDGVTTGTCVLTVSQSGQNSFTLNNTVTAIGTAYGCPTFSIPYSQFPSGGAWKFSLSVQSGGKQASNDWPEPLTVNK